MWPGAGQRKVARPGQPVDGFGICAFGGGEPRHFGKPPGDNHRARVVAQAEAYGLTGLGDRTSVTLFSTLDFQEQQTLQIAHDMRLGGEGLTLGGSLTLGWTEPDALPGFEITSETVLANVEASYPFLRRQESSVWGAIGFGCMVCCGFMTKYFSGHTEITWSKSLRATFDHQVR